MGPIPQFNSSPGVHAALNESIASQLEPWVVKNVPRSSMSDVGYREWKERMKIGSNWLGEERLRLWRTVFFRTAEKDFHSSRFSVQLSLSFHSGLSVRLDKYHIPVWKWTFTYTLFQNHFLNKCLRVSPSVRLRPFTKVTIYPSIPIPF